MWATVAGPRNPANLPLTVSFDPVSTAVSEPDPATLAFMAASMATGARRALKVFATGAAPSAKHVSIARATVARKYMLRFAVKIRIYKYEAPVQLLGKQRMKAAPCVSLDETEAAKLCDGCGESYMASGLFPIGDGSIQVCADCYAAATALFTTRRDL